MKGGMNKQFLFRSLYSLILISASVGVIGLAVCPQTCVSAGQSEAQTAGPSATTDHSPLHSEFPPGDGRKR